MVIFLDRVVLKYLDDTIKTKQILDSLTEKSYINRIREEIYLINVLLAKIKTCCLFLFYEEDYKTKAKEFLEKIKTLENNMIFDLFNNSYAYYFFVMLIDQFEDFALEVLEKWDYVWFNRRILWHL